MRPGAAVASRPKQSTGRLVSSPPAADESPRSSSISSTTGGTLATDSRRFKPASTMPAASSRLPRARVRPTRARRSSRQATSPPRATSRRTRAARAATVRRTRRRRGSRCSIDVIHHEKCSARQTRRSAVSEYRLELRASLACRDRVGEHANVGHREVEPLRPGRRDDVRGVAREVEPTVLHRLDDEAPHAGHALLDDRALVERPARPLSRRAAPPRCARPATPSSGSSGRHWR